MPTHPIDHDLLKQLSRLEAVVCVASGTGIVHGEVAAELGIESSDRPEWAPPS